MFYVPSKQGLQKIVFAFSTFLFARATPFHLVKACGSKEGIEFDSVSIKKILRVVH